MASLVLSGDTSGSITVSAPAVAGSTTQTLVNVSGTLAPIVSGTAVTASGTSVDFTGIPSWVKRITVMFQGVSTNGTSPYQIQIGSGSFITTGYAGGASSGAASVGNSSGFVIQNNNAAISTCSGASTLSLFGSNTWVMASVNGQGGGNACTVGAGFLALSGALDRVRITTVNGTDAFDAGTINIIYE